MAWRWHVTMAASIFNRATGIGLYAGWLVFAGWALALASGPDIYGAYADLLVSPIGVVMLFLVSLSLFFHMAAGIRHLMWDSGRGFAPGTASATAWFAFAFALVANLALWAYLAVWGGF